MKAKALILCLVLLLGLVSGCSQEAPAQVVATTLPVYQFASVLCQGTGIRVERLITQSVSCLHDYSLNVSQVKAIEQAQVIVISGGGLEEFMEDLLDSHPQVIDSSVSVPVLECEEHHDHEHSDHHHDQDAHIWLSPSNAAIMAGNIAAGLKDIYPEQAQIIETNLSALLADLDALQSYGEAQLQALACRDLITFHDGFGYFAHAFDLHILEAIEEESGSEASAHELKEMICMVREHQLPAIFTEVNGSVSAAQIISRETDSKVFALDMAIAGQDYFDAMYHNIDTIKEAMG